MARDCSIQFSRLYERCVINYQTTLYIRLEAIDHFPPFTDDAAADDGIDEIETRERQAAKFAGLLLLLLLLQHAPILAQVPFAGTIRREKAIAGVNIN